MATQTLYPERQAAAVAGMIANMRDWDGITRNCETDAGIGFGLAVGRGADLDKGCVIGGTLADFLGVTQRDITQSVSNGDKYGENNNVGILTKGEIWVQVSVAVTPDSPVHYSATTGIFAASGGTGPVRGARYMSTTTGAGIARLYLSGDPQAAA